MKVIDLLNKIAKGEKPPKYILIVGHRYRFNEKTNDYDSDIGMANKYLFRNMGILSELNEEIKILEDKTEEIEECVIRHYNTPVEKEKYIEEKMNEIIKEINIIKKIFTVDTSKETNCMSE